MELRQLRSLEVLVESGFSVTLAAERLHLSRRFPNSPALNENLKPSCLCDRDEAADGADRYGEQVPAIHRILNDTENILAVGVTRRRERLRRVAYRHHPHPGAICVGPVIRVFREIYPRSICRFTRHAAATGGDGGQRQRRLLYLH